MANHGDQVALELQVIEFGVSLTKLDNIAVSVIDKQGIMSKNAIYLTPENANRIAQSVGCVNRVILANSINVGEERTVLHCVATYKEQGKEIGTSLDAAGNVVPIRSQTTGLTTHSASYWDIDSTSYTIELGQDVAQAINRINEVVAIDMAKDAQKESLDEDRRAKLRRENAAALNKAKALGNTAVPPAGTVIPPAADAVDTPF